ncbi:hypothetical protein [Tardiphaga sp.]|uniref:hypothetical protein n=1 Tax=Tardiphaga sp. TaxID=1926292 RepID=UPI002617BB07|nr:hypothetical protein [Tardiphaga sp.]MDB5616209.1 hypothetical protein [Tardiphaga sp.]
MVQSTHREELYRRLEQSRRLANGAADPTTQDRLRNLTADIERQLAEAEAKDADAPPE